MAKIRQERIKSPYEILGIKPGANKDEIKNAYKKLCLKYHPDRSPGHEEDIKEINNAYAILTGKNEKNPYRYHYEYHFEGQTTHTSTEKILVLLDENGHALPGEDGNHDLETKAEIKSIKAQDMDLSDSPLPFNKKASNEKNAHDSLMALWEALNEPKKVLNYDSSNTDGLDECFIKEKINASKNRYSDHKINEKINGKAFVWKATKKGCAPIYLLGTIHKSYGNILKDVFLEPIKNILSQTDTVFTEIVLRHRHSENPQVTDLDYIVANIAGEIGKQLKPLENEAIRVLLGVNFKKFESIKHLIGLVTPNDIKQFIKQATEQYLNQEIDLNQDNLKEFLTCRHARNKYWMADILNESKNGKSAFVAYGAMHNQGKFGIPNLLANEGYQVMALIKQPPLPTSTFIRWFEQKGNNRLTPWNFPLILNKLNAENLKEGNKKETKITPALNWK